MPSPRHEIPAAVPPSLLDAGSHPWVGAVPQGRSVELDGDWFAPEDPPGSLDIPEHETLPPIDVSQLASGSGLPGHRRSPAFDGILDVAPAVVDDGPPLSKRTARAMMCLVVLAAGGFAAAFGADGFVADLFDRTAEDPAAVRTEAAAAPSTTEAARTPITRSFPQVRRLLAVPDGGTGMEQVYFTGSPADGQDAFAAAVDVAVDGAADPGADEPSADPAVWVEPDLGPESAWVDSGNGVLVPDLQLRIRFCESTNNYEAANRSSSARGAYQFLVKSWDWYGHAAVTGVTEAHLATPAQQDEAALRTLREHGARPWAESRPCWDNPDIDPRYATAKPPQPAPTTTAPAQSTTTTAPTSTTGAETTAPSTDTTAASTTTAPSTTAPSTESTTG